MNGENFAKNLAQLTQSLIAIVIVVLGLFGIITGSQNATVLVPIVTTVIGFVFGVMVPAPQKAVPATSGGTGGTGGTGGPNGTGGTGGTGGATTGGTG